MKKLKIALQYPVPVHYPRFVPYNGTPCSNGHRARRIIQSGTCAECHRLTNKNQKLRDFIGRPRMESSWTPRQRRSAVYKPKKPCNLCGTSERYVSNKHCVNCQRFHSFNYSRKIGIGSMINKRK